MMKEFPRVRLMAMKFFLLIPLALIELTINGPRSVFAAWHSFCFHVREIAIEISLRNTSSTNRMLHARIRNFPL